MLGETRTIAVKPVNLKLLGRFEDTPGGLHPSRRLAAEGPPTPPVTVKFYG